MPQTACTSTNDIQREREFCRFRSLFSFQFDWKAHAFANPTLYVEDSLSFTKTDNVYTTVYAPLYAVSIKRDFFHVFSSINIPVSFPRMCTSRCEALFWNKSVRPRTELVQLLFGCPLKLFDSYPDGGPTITCISLWQRRVNRV